MKIVPGSIARMHNLYKPEDELVMIVSMVPKLSGDQSFIKTIDRIRDWHDEGHITCFDVTIHRIESGKLRNYIVFRTELKETMMKRSQPRSQDYRWAHSFHSLDESFTLNLIDDVV